MTTHIPVTNTDPVTSHLNIRQHITPIISKVQVILDKSGEISDTEYIILRQTPHLQQATSFHHSSKLLRYCSISGKHFLLWQHSSGRQTKQTTRSPSYIPSGRESHKYPAYMVQKFSAIKMPFIRLLQQSIGGLRHILFLHIYILLMHYRIIRKKSYGRIQSLNNHIILFLITSERRRQHNLPSITHITTL